MSSSCPLCVVGISVYKKDNVKWFKVALDSIIQHSWSTVQIIVYIDGKLSSNFSDLIDDYKSNSRIHFIVSCRNLGLSRGINQMLKLGLKLGGDYYFRMDSDDIVMPGRFDTQIAFMESNLDIDICGSSIIEFRGENGYKPNLTVSKRTVPLSHAGIYSGLARTATFNHPTVCFRYTSLVKWNPNLDIYDESAGLAEDYKLWVDLAEAGFKFANLPESLLAFRITEDFYRRRSKARAIAEHKVRMDAMRRLNLFSLKNLLYAYMVLFLRFMPPKILKLAYQFKRKSIAKI